jgi:tetratricopeptide (TPR) repeat protein
MRRILTSTALLWLLSAACSTFAQDAEPAAKNEQPAEPAEAEGQENPPPQVTLEEVIAKTLEMLDRLDARVGQRPSAEELSELNRYIVAIEKQVPDDPKIAYLKGRAWALMGRTGQAITELEKFITAREGRLEWKAFRTLGDLYVDQFPHMAKGNYEKADKLKPKEPSVLFGLSRSYFSLGDFAKALEFARAAVSEDQASNVPYLAHLAKVQTANQQWAQADRTMVMGIELAEKEVAAAPGAPAPLVVLQEQLREMISLLRTRAQMPGATPDEFSRAARYIVEHAEVAAKLALHDAVAVLESAQRHFADPPTAPFLEQYGVLLARIDRNEDAIETFRKLQEMDPENAAAREWLPRLKDAESSSAEAPARPGKD